METGAKIIRNYTTPDGREPFEKWLDSLRDKRAQAIVLERLNRVRLGNFGDCRYLEEGVHELRIHYGPGYRVYFGEFEDVIVILLCGGTKRTQTRDMQRAKSYWQELKKRDL